MSETLRLREGNIGHSVGSPNEPMANEGVWVTVVASTTSVGDGSSLKRPLWVTVVGGGKDMCHD